MALLGNAFPIGMIGVAILVLGTFASPSSFVTSNSASPGLNGVLLYISDVCVEVDRASGDSEVVAGCNGSNDNFFTPSGKNMVMDLLAGGAVLAPGVSSSLSNVTQIALCNISTNTLNGTASQNCYLGSGLGNGSATTITLNVAGQAGNWSLERTFTATSDGNTVNGTVLLNGSSVGSTVFANNSFNAVTLNTNDQITIRWNISIS